jgi:hypothetical protein
MRENADSQYKLLCCFCKNFYQNECLIHKQGRPIICTEFKRIENEKFDGQG